MVQRRKLQSQPPKQSFRAKFVIVIGIAIILVFIGLTAIILSSGYVINLQKDRINKYIDDSFSGQVKVGSIGGNIARGFVLEDVKFIPKSDDFSIPSWTGDRLTLKVGLWSLLNGKVIPQKVVLENFTIRFHQNPDGKFDFPAFLPSSYNSQGGTFQLKNLRFIVKNSMIIYEENRAFVEPPLEPMNLEVDNVNAHGTYYGSGRVVVNRFHGDFLKSKVEFQGQVKTASPYETDISLKIDKLGLSQFARSLARLFPSENKMLPVGDGEVSATFKGTLAKPEINGKCKLNNATLGNANLQEVYFDFKFDNKRLTISNGVAKAYNGRIKLSGYVDANFIPPEFNLDTEVKDIDVGQYIQEMGRGIDPVYGSFSGSFKGNGDFISSSTFTGDGNLNCTNGMYLNPFKGAKGGFFSIRQEDKMGFDSLDVEFDIANAAFNMKKLDMKSKWMDLSAAGEVRFDGTVDLMGTIITSSDLIKSNTRFNDIFPFLSNSGVRIPIRFALTGLPGNYTFHSALTEEAIDKLLGKDEARREAARMLLEQYFGNGNSNITNSITNSIPDMN